MADDDDSTIWIDVKPRLDDSAADSAVSKLKDKMSHAGDSLKDSLSTAFDSIGDHLGGAGGLGDKLHETLAGAFSGKELDGLRERAGTALGGGIHDALGDILHGDLGNVFGRFESVGDVLGGALDKLGSRIDGLQKAGGAVGNVLSGNGSGQDIPDILGGAQGLGFSLPGPLGGISHAQQIIDEMNKHPGKTEDWLSQHIPGMGTAENILEKGPQELGGKIHDWFTGTPASPARDPASDKWSKQVADSISVDASVATISAGSINLGGSIPGLPSGRPSDSPVNSGHGASSGIAAAGADSSSMASLYSGGGGTTIGKGHYASGGTLPGDSPGHDNMLGVLPNGMVGLEGGEGVLNPRAMSKPGVAALVASLNKGYDEGTTSVGGDPNNETLAMPPTQSNTPAPQQKQLGSGQGGGISGGGLIGAAEQAGVMAAAVGGFGGGGIAAQMAVQESNLAVQKTSQLVAAAAEAPLETAWLGGGQMGAPQLSGSPFGWAGKLLGGALGQQNQIPNMAAKVQPPKQPEMKDPQQDPAGAKPPPSGGPSGAKDDPMHVNVTNQPAPSQGSATAASNFSALAGITLP